MSVLYTVLAVDDDPHVLEIVAKVLEVAGYTVLTAQDGYEAIRVLAERHVDLMIADIRMPGLDGIQLSIQAKLMRPNLHIFHLTGFAEAAAKARYGRVIEKPVRADDLIKAVQNELTAA